LFGYEVKKLEKNKLTYYYLSNTLETPKIYSDYEIARESFLMIVLGLINTTKEKKFPTRNYLNVYLSLDSLKIKNIQF